METLDTRTARRLALVRAGLLRPQLTGLPRLAAGGGQRAHEAALRVIRRFGYLQLDSVSVAGARSHGLVLLSRLGGYDPARAERLLRPGSGLFEYWGHETSWIPQRLYPVFGFRRRQYRVHPWWGDLLAKNRGLARDLVQRIERRGPSTAAELCDRTSQGGGWWNWSVAKKVLAALWSAGELAIRCRVHFRRVYDLPDRVIPESVRRARCDRASAFRVLMLRALAGHGWAGTTTLVETFRLREHRRQAETALRQLQEAREVLPCALVDGARRMVGWVRPVDLELAAGLGRLRPRSDRGVLLSPFDPLLWDRARTARLFGFRQMIEIYKPPAARRYGYYCLPVLAGDRLVARVDLRADRSRGTLSVLSRHYESDRPTKEEVSALRTAVARHATALQLAVRGVGF